MVAVADSAIAKGTDGLTVAQLAKKAAMPGRHAHDLGVKRAARIGAMVALAALGFAKPAEAHIKYTSAGQLSHQSTDVTSVSTMARAAAIQRGPLGAT